MFDTVRQLQAGICVGLGIQNPKIMKSLYALLSRLMSVIGNDSVGGVARTIEDLEVLYQAIVKTITEGMGNFEKCLCS